jgi:hypothetical protein
MSAARELDQSDFDLDRFVDLFDEALTSTDPRVVETLRKLMMIVTLTRPESSQSWNHHRGPLRRMMEDINHLHRRIERVEEETRQARNQARNSPYDYPYEKYTMAATQNMAQTIDQDLPVKIREQNIRQVTAKGLLDK